MDTTTQLVLRVPTKIWQTLKLASVYSKKSMNEIVTDILIRNKSSIEKKFIPGVDNE